MKRKMKTDKGTTHSYLEVYDELFKDLKNITLLEIGTQYGGSLELWRDKFPGSEIYGVDINPQGYPEGVSVIKADATKEVEELKGIEFDVIIDDGSHKVEDQLKTLELFYPKLKKGGLYIIEDIQDIDKDKNKFINNTDIIDRRAVKDRYDDVLIVYKK